MFKRLSVLALTALALCLALTGCRAQTDNPEVWKTSFTGVWELDGDVTNGTKISSKQLTNMKQSGMNCFFILNETGTCRMNLCGKAYNHGTWTATGPNEAILTFSAVTAQDEAEAAEAEAAAEAAKKNNKDGAATEQDEPDEAQEVTKTYEYTINYRNDQLVLEVDKNGSLIFSRTTHASMTSYLDSVSMFTDSLDGQVASGSGLNSLGRLLSGIEQDRASRKN